MHLPKQDKAPLITLAQLLRFELRMMGSHPIVVVDKGRQAPLICRQGFHLDEINPADMADLLDLPEKIAQLQNKPYDEI